MARRISTSFVPFCSESGYSCIVSRQKVAYHLILVAHRVGRHLFQQGSPLSVQDPPPRRSTLFPSKLLGYAPASFAQGENGGECREATLSRLLLYIFMKYRTL